MENIKNKCQTCFYNNGSVCINHAQGFTVGNSNQVNLYGANIDRIDYCVIGYRREPAFLKPQED
ncbi:MAG: hypothetical protein ACRDDY_00450 [Clostridium sp.]|uniref:hypothetical protein n=1 Tax=Clostridium sp. TaxID=1506 RepID=UPI003EE434B4